jgi:CRISPR-associated protein Csm3
MSTLTLKKKYLIKGHLRAVSGLHIGGNDAGLGIGSPDAVVIKHPILEQPYVPGSSIKGKMRSLFEISRGEIGNERMGVVENGPSNNLDVLSARIFGNANNGSRQRPSRVIVRDAVLSETQDENRDFSVVEIKTEVVIDRITSKAMPRSMERVPAGAKFDLEIIVNVFLEDEEDYLESVLSSLMLLQDDYLGGKGSRGSGQISICIESIEARFPEFYQDPSTGVQAVKDEFEAKFPELFC